MSRRRGLVVLATGLALAAAGCQDPYSGQPRPPAAPTTTSTAPVAREPRSVVRAFATRWVNWDWRSAVHQQRALARLAAAGLAAQLRANATSARVDAGLARDKPGTRGTVATIDLARRGTGMAGLVVTLERTYTGDHAELGGARYHVYRVRLSHARHRWEVSAWQPQP